MPEIVQFVDALIEQRAAYESDGDVYFDVGKVPNMANPRTDHRSMQGDSGQPANENATLPTSRCGKPPKRRTVLESPGAMADLVGMECSAMGKKLLGGF
jgi:cysteinyl-tRNA synthetase